jgi:ATP-dependent Clp protease ATP-binding subunit ClpA
MVEALAESLVGDAHAVIKIDCAEFQHSHEIAKLIGSPPGYLGHRETHPLLSQEVLNQFHTEKVKLSFVLFDEIEKASDSLWNLLLGILDKATLTLGDNRRVDFSRAMIFMTSNLGANEMASILRPNLGFAAGEMERRRATGEVDQGLNDKAATAGMEAARRKFTPEFINRIDHVVVFQSLGTEALRKILNLELNVVQQRIFSAAHILPFVISVAEPAKDFLLSEGTDLKYGARHLKRAIDRHLVHPLSNLMASSQVRGGDLVRVDFDVEAGKLIFYKDAEDLSAHAMLGMVDDSIVPPPMIATTTAVAEMPRVVNAKSTRR